MKGKFEMFLGCKVQKQDQTGWFIFIYWTPQQNTCSILTLIGFCFPVVLQAPAEKSGYP